MDCTSQTDVLIVDDDKLNQLVLTQTLQHSYRTHTVSSGEAALDWLKQHRCNIILLDIQMPGLDGYQVIKELKEHPIHKTTPVIFISANTNLEDEIKGLELGAVDYIMKPFRPPIVLARVKNQLLLKQKTDLLERLAAIDGLTELPNRRYFDENIDKEFRRCVRARHELSVLMMDVDYFKLYNDHYGHQKGDDCLKQIADQLQQYCRRGGDFVARYGGEEFVMVLPGASIKQAQKTAKKILDGIRELALEHCQSDVSDVISLSIGIASLNGSGAKDQGQLVEAADKALYQAKALGRNQYFSAT